MRPDFLWGFAGRGRPLSPDRPTIMISLGATTPHDSYSMPALTFGSRRADLEVLRLGYYGARGDHFQQIDAVRPWSPGSIWQTLW
jgi:hypothetical protein